jgi:cyanate permease
MMAIAGRRSGVAGGIMNTGSKIGGLIAPALTPAIAAAVGWNKALELAALLSLVAAAVWLFIHPGEGKGKS